MIKICGITDVSTALSAAEAGATAVGLVFADSPRRVGTVAAAAIAGALPPGIERVGVFRAADLRRLPDILASVRLDAVQVHGLEAPSLTLDGLPVIPAFRASFPVGLRHSRLLLDSPAGEGSGQAWDFKQVRGIALRRGLILAGGLNPANVTEAISIVRPYGVDVSSGVEGRRGRKDVGLVRAFVQAAREAFAVMEAGART
ncbi:MAG: phosphoribosylanthranilate isomerase [Planctomycetes bacterium]|nr:phosphoribosylanthranilate isomerase [Planctomycetota bacterium]MCW8136420.1 phosphoribosylanthranilate isomerase [Planctomycetota bacterium]